MRQIHNLKRSSLLSSYRDAKNYEIHTQPRIESQRIVARTAEGKTVKKGTVAVRRI